MARERKSVPELLESHEFKALVVKRWSVSIALTLALFAIYYGYILLVGYKKELLSCVVSESMTPNYSVVTLGIQLGVGVIVSSWVLTVIYVVWANAYYDPEVQKLKDQLK